jgi:hypothetical protein
LRERPTILGETLDQMSTTEHSCPKGIAAELYNVAKANDALDAIGGSTSWRWQEGLISRMPKASTVAAVLTKAFDSNEPSVWYKKVDKNLATFIAKTFGIETNNKLFTGDIINDIYESAVLISISSGNGSLRSDLIYQLSFYKYSSSLDDDDDSYYEEPDQMLILSMYGMWAERKLDKILAKFMFSKDGDYYTFMSENASVSSEKHARNCLELVRLRSRVVGGTSVHDMWRNHWYNLSDTQHIEIEKKMIKFFHEIDTFIRHNYDNSCKSDKTLKPRLYSYNAMMMPTRRD